MLKSVIGGKDVSVIFDGSIRLGEAIAIIFKFRFVNNRWEVIQRLVRIDVVAKWVTAVQLSQVLMECLFTDLQLKGQQIKAVMRDGAAINGAALTNMQASMPSMVDGVFLTHP